MEGYKIDFLERLENSKSVSYKCYTANYYKDKMFGMEFHNLEIWKTDYKNDAAFMVIHATLEKEPTEEDLLRYIKNYIKKKDNG